MTKHTPGPWHVVEGKLSKSALEVHADSRAICELWRRGNAKTELANARLIAAAPEMLKALQDFVSVYGIDDVPRWMRALDKAIAAIAKATGESS